MSEHPRLPDIVERLRKGCIGHPHAKIPWPHRILHEAADEIQRLRPRWEEAIEAAAKVADETAALEDKHDRYEAWRAAHDIAQTIRSLLPSIAAPPNKEKP